LPFPGVKAHLTGFYINKNDMITSVGNGQYEQVSSAVYKGGEVDLSCSLTSSIHVSGGYSYTVATVDEYSENASDNLEGKSLRFAPEHMANFWLRYDSPDNGLGLGIGGNYFGNSYSDRQNEILLPSYLVLDGNI
ncbi:MAG: TonB-dependent receptor domain-containing protein, partial [Flavobacteriales bacterium]